MNASGSYPWRPTQARQYSSTAIGIPTTILPFPGSRIQTR